MTTGNDERDKRLQLLRSIPPLLDDALPSAPASPAPTASAEASSELALRDKLVFDKPDAQTRDSNAHDWRQQFPNDRLRQLASTYRTAGRQVKHKGDARREDPLLSLALQTDAVCLYTFAFWCDDTAKKSCLKTNWTSMFGLISYIRRAAEKLGEQGRLILALCAKLEAVVVLTLYEAEQKVLAYKGAQAPAIPTISSASTLSSTSPTLPATSLDGGAHNLSPPSAPSDASAELVKSFTKSSHDYFRALALNASAATLLLPAHLCRHLPATWRLCVENAMNCEGVYLPEKPWRFAWPVEGRGQSGQGVPSIVTFCRAVLDEMLALHGCGRPDWSLDVVSESA